MAATTFDLESARELIARCEWQEAYRLLNESDQGALTSAEHLALLGTTAWWSGHLDAAIEAHERAYSAYLAAGDPIGAAAMARKLRSAHSQKLEHKLAKGWSRRRVTLLEDAPLSVEHGWLKLSEADRLTDVGELDEALKVCAEVASIARELGSHDLEALELGVRGLVLATKGAYEEGFELIDEAAAAAMGTDISADAAGIVFCNVISGCIQFSEYSRASEHSSAAKRWCSRQDINGFPGVCRVYQASMLRLRGSWKDAEQEAIKARDELTAFGHLNAAAAAFDEIGELQLRRGDLEAADEAFRRAHALGHEPQPGLALLSLERGDPEDALSSITHALDDAVTSFSRAQLLPVQVTAALAVGQPDVARQAADELEVIARNGSAALRAQALESLGRVQLSEAEPEGVKTLRSAVRLWQEVEAPFEVARTQVLLGQAYRSSGDEAAATRELQAAQQAFSELGAMRAAANASALINPVQEPAVAAVKTFMFTDIVESTPLVQAMGDEAWNRLLRWHDRTIRSCIEEAGGSEVKATGDGFFIAFDDAASAVMCAIGIQRRFADHREEHGFAPRVRIGLHATSGMEDAGDFSGQGVHEAARIGSVAGADEIVASSITVVGLEVDTSDRRSTALKGFAEPVEIVTIPW